MPCNRAFFQLDMAPSGALPSRGLSKVHHTSGCVANLSVILKYLVNFAHPIHVQTFGEICPSIMPRFSDEPTMLSRHAQVLKVPKVMFQEILVTPGDDVDNILRVTGQLRNCFEGLFRGHRHTGRLHDGCKGSLL
jgi:hypothetical protein